MRTMSFEEIKKTIYQYYPKNLYDTEPNYRDTIEFKKLEKICLSATKDCKLWNDFLFDIREEFKDYEVEDCTQLFHYDRCYRCKIDLKSEFENVYRSLVLHVSIIAPFVSIYVSEIKLENGQYTQPKISFKPTTKADQEEFSKAYISLKKVFGYDLLPEELVTMRVPDVAVGNKLLNESTVFHCIFTDHII